MSTTTAPTIAPDSAGLLIPEAAIVCIVMGTFVVIIILLLILRKIIIAKGVAVSAPRCSACSCCDDVSLCDCFRGVAETTDCKTPDCQVCMDKVCPTKENCRLACGRFWSCYVCHMLADYCKGIECPSCPTCPAIECPDFSCCNCKCTLRMPECSHVTCLCFECGTAT